LTKWELGLIATTRASPGGLSDLDQRCGDQ
jgi:hypothetical protein